MHGIDIDAVRALLAERDAVRRELGVRTIFNILGPLTNPADAPNILMGVFHPDLVGIQVRVLQRLGSRHVMVVHAMDGMDELSISGETQVGELVDGEVRELFVLRPDRMRPVKGPRGWPVAWEHRIGSDVRRIAREADGFLPVMHLRLFHPANDYEGQSPLEAAQYATDDLARSVVEAFNDVMAEKPVLTPELRASVYEWIRHLPGATFAQLLTEDSLKNILSSKVSRGLV